MTDEPTDEQPAAASDAAADAPSGAGADASGEDDAAPRRRLTRGRDHKVLAGVCDGAGRYFDIDPVIFRVVLAVLSLTGGIGLIIYGMGWLVIPQEGERQSEAHRLLSGRIEGAPLTAVLMALVGCGLYASMLDNGTNQGFSLLLLTATAGAVYWSYQRRSGQLAGEPASSVAASAVADAPPAVQAPPEPGSASWWRDPLTKDAPAYLWGPDDGPYEAADKKAWRERKAAARRQDRSWPFGLAVFLSVVCAAAIGTGSTWDYQPLSVSLEVGLAAALFVFGVAFVVASFAGRARGGTVFFSLLTIAALVGAASLPKHGTGWGATAWRPTTASAVQTSYDRGAGRGLLDLTAVPLGGKTVTTRVKVGAGRAEVRLPADATVNLDYDLGIGELVLPGKVNDGVRIQKHQHTMTTISPPQGTLSAGTINLHVEVGVGQIKVEVVR